MMGSPPRQARELADLIAIDPEPVGADVVAYLEHQLARAREGTLSAIAVAYVYRDGTTGSGFSRQHNLAAMTGAVTALQAKLVADMIE